MFHVFRRHQKLLLTSIAVIAIGSMAFSAIAPLFMEDKAQSSQTKDLIKDPNQALVKFYNHSFDSAEKDIIFPQALFTETVILTNLATTVFDAHKETITSELNDVFAKISTYSPPEVIKGATLFDVVTQISPKMGQLISDMKAANNLSSEQQLELLCRFFEEKSRFPVPLIYQYLVAISKNNVLVSAADLDFFGLKKPEDFFGKTFVETAAKFVHFALQEETKLLKPHELIFNFSEKLKSFYGSYVHPNQFFVALGVSPECGLEILKTVEALKQLQKMSAQSILLDPLSYKAIHEFSAQKVPVNTYTYNPLFAPKNLEEAFCLDLYAASKDELVFDQYEVKIRALEKSKALQKLPKKQQYAQALKGYDELSTMMPYALSKQLTEEKDRLEAIKNLQGKSKDMLEAQLQKAFIKEDPEFFQKLLQDIPSKNETLYLAKGAKTSPLCGFISCDDLKKELDILPVSTPVIFDVADQYLYEIELISKTCQQKELSYEKALQTGYLKDALKTKLEPTYRELVKKSPHKLMNSDKKLKTLDEAMTDVIEISAKDLKKKLAISLGLSDDLSSQFLLKGYPKLVLEEALKDEKKRGDFRIIKQQEFLSRNQMSDKNALSFFQSGGAKFSGVIMHESGDFVFYEKSGDAFVDESSYDKGMINNLAKEKASHTLKTRILNK